MKNLKNKKGFTLVELVIVIAVIAILAAVLIPTFSNVVENANKSAAQQAAVNVYKQLVADDLADDGLINNTMDKITLSEVKAYTPANDGSELSKFQYQHSNGYTATLENGEWTVTR